MANKPLVSIFITYFNTGDIVYETIDSVLAQDYSNIELIISDDCSDRAPMGDVASYIEKNKKDNINNIIIRRNDVNLGTVKHVELIREMCNGEFCMGIAGDDLFGSNDVVSKMVEEFEQLGPEAEYMIGQVEMFDQDMENSSGYCVEKSTIELLKNEDWEELLNKESETSRLVGQCMCRTSLFAKLPRFSDEYQFVEDYSCHMWLLRNNYHIYWCDMVIVKHRGGGISHGNIANKRELYAFYCKDYMTVFETQVEPYRNKLDATSYAVACQTYQFFKYQKETTLKMCRHPVVCRLLLARNASDYSNRVSLIKKLISFNTIIQTLVVLLLLLMVFSLNISIVINFVIMLISVAFALLFVVEVGFFFTYYFYKLLRHMKYKFY